MPVLSNSIPQNGNGKAPNQNFGSDDYQEPRVQGHWIPIEVWELAEQNDITFAELRLLAYVNSLVKAKGLGCYSSVERLAAKIGRSQSRTDALLKKLKDLRLLREVGTVTIRNKVYKILETSWSRVRDDEEPLAEKAARLEQELRAAKKCFVRVQFHGMGSRAIENNSPRAIENDRHNTPNGVRGEGPPVKSKPGTPPKPRLDPPPKPSPDNPHRVSAEKLRKALRENRQQVSPPNITDWTNHLRLLKEADQQEYADTLDWFCLNCSESSRKRLNLPAIRNTKEFRARYNWIRDRYNQHCPKDERPSKCRFVDLGNGRIAFVGKKYDEDGCPIYD